MGVRVPRPPFMKIGVLPACFLTFLLAFLTACADQPSSAFARMDLAPDGALGIKYDLGISRSIVELPDGKVVVASYFRPTLTLLDSTAAVLSELSTTDFAQGPLTRVTYMDVTADGRILVLDGDRNRIYVLRVNGSKLEMKDNFTTRMFGHTLGMCVADDRLFVMGARSNGDSTVLHEIVRDSLISSFGTAPDGQLVTLRRMRLAQMACSDSHIVLAPPGTGDVMFYDLNGVQRAVVPVPGHDDVLFAKSRDPFEPKIRRNEWNEWNNVHYAPDGTLIVQYDHYKGMNFDRTVTHSFNEAGGWTARPDKLPRLTAMGTRHAYGSTDGSRDFITRYKYE